MGAKKINPGVSCLKFVTDGPHLRWVCKLTAEKGSKRAMWCDGRETRRAGSRTPELWPCC